MTIDTVSKGGGCHKCGQRGHWARDCTNSSSIEVQTAGNDDSLPVEVGADMATPQGAQPLLRKRLPRQKLTLALLQESKGIPDVENNFYTAMKSVFRGKGHEISDTRRLLELYKRWSDRVLPHSGPNDTFDTFIADTEKLSSTSEVKHMMNNKRVELLDTAVEASKLELEEQEELCGDEEDHNDEEELLELAMTGAEEDRFNDHGDNNDEEMLELLEAGHDGGTSVDKTTLDKTPDEPVELQDDELLDLLF